MRLFETQMHKLFRRIAAVAVLISLAAGLAACGGMVPSSMRDKEPLSNSVKAKLASMGSSARLYSESTASTRRSKISCCLHGRRRPC